MSQSRYHESEHLNVTATYRPERRVVGTAMKEEEDEEGGKKKRMKSLNELSDTLLDVTCAQQNNYSNKQVLANTDKRLTH